MNTLLKFPYLMALTLCFCLVPSSDADNFIVDRVYHPYVLPLEKELEWRFTSRQNDDGNLLNQRFAYGYSIAEDIMLQGFVVAERDAADNFGFAAFELELTWMLTEQGAQWADWGLLFEIEKLHDQDVWEFRSGVLTEKEFGRYSLTTNAIVQYEWGDDIENELETELRVQYRYRWIPQVQPAIEFYAGEGYMGIGPAFMGIQRYQGQKQLKWELGFITALNSSKDHSLRFQLEFEF